MIYVGNITIPANTLSTSPTVERIKVVLGLVYRVEIQFPPGCCGLAHIAIKDGGHQLWPSTPGVDFAADGYTIAFDDTYLKHADPSELQIYGYNEDETYDHTIQVRLGMASEEAFMARYLPSISFDRFLETLELMKKDKEEQTQAFIENPWADLVGEI